MTIPPRFLDELRARINVSDIVGKRVRLTRAGREFRGCCPFHNEKTPSFYVNDDKQFFHCFGCGAHGSIIDFAMRHDNLSFPEAVESLAGIAGMQVPQSAPADIEKAKAEKTLYTLMDEAAKWMEEQLRQPAHKVALDYMYGRGINDETLSAFRVGYVPGDMQAMRKYLSLRGYSDAQMVEAGLIKISDKGREPYAFFRERVMFPVPDRRGRIVAFGGRILPDHLRPLDKGDFKPPKYINSIDTPLFHKGRMLYGEPHARQAAAEGAPVIVVEGYLDVIAANRGGFRGAVAPLGTALTEDQIMILWKIIPGDSKIPFLCFDGDNAGRRAASRACERILPLLKPDHSAKIAFLPEGEDPDSLIRQKGASAFQAVLDGAVNLVDFMYLDLSEGRELSTPEDRAGFSRALEEAAGRIVDRTVQHYYREALREKLRKAFAGAERTATGGGNGYAKKQYDNKWRGGKFGDSPPPVPVAPLRRPAFNRNILFPLVFMACVINNPGIFHDVEEDLGNLNFPENELDRVRQAVLSTLGRNPDLDSEALQNHLVERGFDAALERVLSEQIYTHAAFCRASDDPGAVLTAWREAWGRMQAHISDTELETAKAALKQDLNKDNETRWEALAKKPKGSDG